MPLGVPPLASSGVFSFGDSIVIDAPREKVWKTLLDFESYKEWNPFIRNQIMVSDSGATLRDQTLLPGKTMLLHPIHSPPTMSTPGFMGTLSVTVIVTVVDHENFRAAWESALGLLPRWALHAERWQMLTVVEGGKTRYESIEVFKGPLAYIIKWFVGHNMLLGTKAMAEGLKQRVEAVAR